MMSFSSVGFVRFVRLALALGIIAGFSLLPAHGESQSNWGNLRISLYAQNTNYEEADGTSSSLAELVTIFSLQSPHRDSNGFEYGVDFRAATFPSTEDRDTRFSLYNAYVGSRFMDGKLGVRGGQMWLNELGALGSVGGGAVEYKGPETSAGTWRFAGFGGWEPEIADADYADSVTKFGGFAALEGENGRSHTFGYVRIENAGITERSVIVFTNYLPVENSFFLYQTLEYDLTNPAEDGSDGLTFFFLNARYKPHRRVDLQGIYQRGRSIDMRSISDDVRNGRPVNPETARGFLFESADFRTTVRVVQNLSIFGSAGFDRNNRNEMTTNRYNIGLFTPDVVGSGMDLRASYTQWSPEVADSYDSWSISVGRTFLERLYLSLDYSSISSVVFFTGEDGLVVQNLPSSDRWSLSALVNLNYSVSLLATVDRTMDLDRSQTTVLGGVTFRFR